MPKSAAEALADILGERLEVVSNGEHFPTFLEPHAVGDLLDQHIRRVASARQ